MGACCSADQKPPTQPGAPIPRPQTPEERNLLETPDKHSEKHAASPVDETPAKFHLPNSPSSQKYAGSPSPAIGSNSPPQETDLLADLRNQPSLEDAEAEERRRQEDAALLEKIRQEAEEKRLKAEAEQRAKDEEARREQEERERREQEEAAERARQEAEAAKRAQEEAEAEAQRKAEADRKKALAFVEEQKRAKEAEEAELRAQEEREREEAARLEALAKEEEEQREAEAREITRLEEEERQRRIEEAKLAEEEREKNEIAAQRAKEEAEEEEKRAAEDRISEANAQRKADVRARVEDLVERTEIHNLQGVSAPALFHCELLWLEDFTGEKLKPELANLKSGELLCKAVNKVQPNSANFKDSTGPWIARQNILEFTKACEELGLKKQALFEPQDLHESQNLNNVVKTLDVFYRTVSKRDGFEGPYMLAPEDADDNFNRPSVSSRAPNVNTPTGKKPEFGMHQDMRQKQNEKLEKEAANIEKVSDWLKKLSGMEFKDFQEGLRSGEVLCKAANKIQKNKIKKIHTDNKPFRQRENIESFLKACRDFGLKDQELFSPDDLFEGKNLLAVAECLISLNRLLKNGKVAEFQ